MELLRWPNPYRDYFALTRPLDAEIACGGQPWVAVRDKAWELSLLTSADASRLYGSVKDALDMKGLVRNGALTPQALAPFAGTHVAERIPGAPLRAFNYSCAGGALSNSPEDDGTIPAIMKFGLPVGSSNVYDQKIVVLDEAHNLLRRDDPRFDRLRCLSSSAKGLTLGAFTATPVLESPQDGQAMMNIIGGSKAASLVSFSREQCQFFPTTIPANVADGSVLADVSTARKWVTRVRLAGFEKQEKWFAWGCLGRLLQHSEKEALLQHQVENLDAAETVLPETLCDCASCCSPTPENPHNGGTCCISPRLRVVAESVGAKCAFLWRGRVERVGRFQPSYECSR